MTITQNENYDSLDLLKLILSFVIVAIHVNPLGDKYAFTIYPLARIAVPVFFIISSFLFFSKYDLMTQNEQAVYLKKYIKRNSKLYIFWFLLLLPFTLYVRNYFKYGVLDGICKIATGLLLGSTFKGSWYLMASIIGTLIVSRSGVSKKGNNAIIWIIAIVAYLVCCGQCGYYPLIAQSMRLKTFYNSLPMFAPNSFLVSLVWICMGRSIAKANREGRIRKSLYSLGGLLFSIILLAIEGGMIYWKGWFSAQNDCYLFLLPTAPLFFC